MTLRKRYACGWIPTVNRPDRYSITTSTQNACAGLTALSHRKRSTSRLKQSSTIRLALESMIIAKSKKEIEKMRAAGQLVGLVLQELRHLVAPGVTTLEVDRAADKMIRDAGAFPTFKGYHGFPYSICASVNEQVVHGFPSNYTLKEGDIFSIDVGVTLEGFMGDTATTVPVGNVSDDRLRLIKVTEECLQLAIDQCRAGKHLGDIGW